MQLNSDDDSFGYNSENRKPSFKASLTLSEDDPFSFSYGNDQYRNAPISYDPMEKEISFSQDSYPSFSSSQTRQEDKFSPLPIPRRNNNMSMNSYPSQSRTNNNQQLSYTYLNNSYNMNHYSSGVPYETVDTSHPLSTPFRQPTSTNNFINLHSNNYTTQSNYPRIYGMYSNEISNSPSLSLDNGYSPSSSSLYPSNYNGYHEDSFYSLHSVPSSRQYNRKLPPLSSAAASYSTYSSSRDNEPYEGVEETWAMKGNQQKKSKRPKKGNKHDKRNSSIPEKETEPPTIEEIRQEIQANKGNLMELAIQQQGCRHLQVAITEDGNKVVELLLNELSDQLKVLMTNPFGNYLFQEIIETSTEAQLRFLVIQVKDSLREASKDTHGTRCVQKLIQVCKQQDVLEMIINSICPYIVELSSSVNGNHVIKRCMTSVKSPLKEQLFDTIIDHCIPISKAVYGCCVVQKCIELATGSQRERLLQKIEESAIDLMKHPCGNYVIQYLIENTEASESDHFCRCVLTHVESLAKEKYSSNVVEKALKLGSEETRDLIIQEIVQSKDLLSLLLDDYANYVIQKAILLSNPKQHEILKKSIFPFAKELNEKKIGRHIITRIKETTV